MKSQATSHTACRLAAAAALAALALVALSAPTANAQVITAYYAPAPLPAPVYVAPVRQVTYYRAPAYYQPAPVVVQPVVAPVAYEPTYRVRSRYRPILGGTVTRVRGGFLQPVYPIVRY